MKLGHSLKTVIATIFITGFSTHLYAAEITAPELASFLGISSWQTKVLLPQDSYKLEVCPILQGTLGSDLFSNSVDWSKDKTGEFILISGPKDDAYRITVTSQTNGTYGTVTKIPLFEATYSPALPKTISEGVYILFVDMVDRKPQGAQNDPATYKRGFVLRVTKKG